MGFSEPLIVACYDTELFGLWWWEGVDWLGGGDAADGGPGKTGDGPAG